MVRGMDSRSRPGESVANLLDLVGYPGVGCEIWEFACWAIGCILMELT
jgi:hypothetical protein